MAESWNKTTENTTNSCQILVVSIYPLVNDNPLNYLTGIAHMEAGENDRHEIENSRAYFGVFNVLHKHQMLVKF